MGITTSLGSRVLRTVAGDDSQYASEPQLEIARDDLAGCWLIRHVSSAKNSTYFDGAALGESPQPIQDGKTISLGSEKMKLTVRLEY